MSTFPSSRQPDADFGYDHHAETTSSSDATWSQHSDRHADSRLSSSMTESVEEISVEPTNSPDRVTLQLLEERLKVRLKTQKVGEVVVRKETETRVVEVPLRREKLIVEQVSPTFRELAAIHLGDRQFPAESVEFNANNGSQVLYLNCQTLQDANETLDHLGQIQEMQFSQITLDLTLRKGNQTELATFKTQSIETVRQLLRAIALDFFNQCRQVRIGLMVESHSLQELYQHSLVRDRLEQA